MNKLIIIAAAVLVVTGSSALEKSNMTRLADAHSDACDYNYAQCMDGCDGASGCEGQCQANYEGCMSQGQ
jgi:hypothetical protein